MNHDQKSLLVASALPSLLPAVLPQSLLVASALPTVSAPCNEPAVLRRHPILMPLAMTPLPHQQLASKDLPLGREYLFDTRAD